MKPCRSKLSFVLFALVGFTFLNFFLATSEQSPVHTSNHSSNSTSKVIPRQQIQHFTDLLTDFNEDDHATKPSNVVVEETSEVENVPLSIVETKEADPSAWLIDNPNIITWDEISDDVMPDYFDMSRDLPSQFEQHLEETKMIMEARLQRVKEQCVTKSQYLKRAQDFLFVFPGSDMAWCPTFKAGSTNWKQFFCKQYEPEIYYKYQKLGPPRGPYCPLGDLFKYHYAPKSKPELAPAAEAAFKFLTVRHPYQRLISVYTNKFKNCESDMFTDTAMLSIFQIYRAVKLPTSQKAEFLEAARLECHKPVSERIIDPENPYMNPMGATFHEMIQYVVGNFHSRKFPDFHWVPITRGCDMCITEYNLIEKFETMERDHHFLLTTLGQISKYPDIAGAHSNQSGAGMTIEKMIRYFSQLNERLLWDLQAIYKDDMALFGYNPVFRVKKNPYNND